ncbi:MAG: dihydrofolate reductase family protein [Solirubrobacterales bacterium]
MAEFRGHVFIGVSADGFIARPDGALEWLTGRELDMNDSGYPEFFAGVDGLIMGRTTYETVLEFDEWPYEKPLYVISSTLSESGREDVSVHPDVESAIAAFTGDGHTDAYVDGGVTIQSFLAAGLIDTITLSYAPVLIGEGARLFGAVPADIELELLEAKELPADFAQTRYRVKRSR